MDAGLIALLNIMMENGILADSTLFVVIISLMVYGYRKILKPVKTKVDTIPSEESFKSIIDKKFEVEEVNIEEVTQKLDKIVEILDGIDEVDRSSNREILEVKHDVEQIKQILNQFQGHMMYGGNRSDFGNRELK